MKRVHPKVLTDTMHELRHALRLALPVVQEYQIEIGRGTPMQLEVQLIIEAIHEPIACADELLS